jgi:Uma2 family endonuclease
MIKGNTQLLTEKDYLDLEASSQVRHELYNGNLIEMPGGTKFHERLIKNLFFLLGLNQIPDTYELFFSGMRLNIPGQNSFFYPDVLLAISSSGADTYFDDALFIAEVLSPRIRTFDTVDKFIEYRKLTSLQYYLLAEPEYYHVTLHYKAEDGTWQSDTYRKLTDIIKLPLIDAELPIAEVYKGLEWD